MYKIFGKKPNQQGERLVLWKLQNIAERKTQVNGKTSHVNGIENLILLGYQYHPRRSTNLKSQRHFWNFLKTDNILKVMWNLKGPQLAKTIWQKNMEESHVLTSKHIIKLHIQNSMVQV